MPMQQRGLVKTVEEFGEALQVLAKLLAYPELQDTRTYHHPDGTCLLDRIEEEFADAQAAMAFVEHKLNLNSIKIVQRRHMKLTKFHEWDKEPAQEPTDERSYCGRCFKLVDESHRCY